MANDTKIEITFDAVIGSLQAGLNKAVGSVQSATNQMTGAFATMQSKIFAITALLGGGAVFKNIIDETIKWNMEAVKLASQLGITTEKASVLNLALGDSRNTIETYETAYRMLTRTMKTNEQAVSDLIGGVKDSNGNYLGTSEILEKVVGALSKFKKGTDQNIEGSKIFNRSWFEVIGLMRLTPEVLKAAEEKAKRLGLTVGPEGAAQAKQYKAAMNDVEDVVLALKIKIGNVLLPVLTSLGKWFDSIGPEAITVFSGALKGLTTFVESISLGFYILYEAIKTTMYNIINTFVMTANVIKKALSGDISGAVAEAKAGLQSYSQSGSEFLNNVSEAAIKTNERLKALWGLSNKPASTSGGGDDGGGKGSPGAPAKDSEVMSKWEAQLAALRVKETLENGRFYAFSLAQERDFWKSKIAEAGSNANLKAEVLKRVNALEYDNYKSAFAAEIEALRTQMGEYEAGNMKRVEIANQIAQKVGEAYHYEGVEYEKALKGVAEAAQENENYQFDTLLASLNEQEVAFEDYNYKKIEIAQYTSDVIASWYGRESAKYSESQQHLLQVAKAYADNLIAIEQQNIDQRVAMADEWFAQVEETLNQEVEMKRISEAEKIAVLREAENIVYGIRMQALNDEMMLLDQESAAYKAMLNKKQLMEDQHKNRQIASTNAQTNATRNAWMGVFTPITNSFSNAINNMLFQGQSLELGLINVFRGILSRFIEMCINMIAEWLIVKVILGQPFSLGGFFGFSAGGNVPSAAGGWDIPSAAGGFNVGNGIMAKLHEREMVLPAELADKVRGMTDTGRGINATFQITAMDSKDVARALKNSGSSLNKAFQQMFRDKQLNFKPG